MTQVIDKNVKQTGRRALQSYPGCSSFKTGLSFSLEVQSPELKSRLQVRSNLCITEHDPHLPHQFCAPTDHGEEQNISQLHHDSSCCQWNTSMILLVLSHISLSCWFSLGFKCRLFDYCSFLSYYPQTAVSTCWDLLGNWDNGSDTWYLSFLCFGLTP